MTGDLFSYARDRYPDTPGAKEQGGTSAKAAREVSERAPILRDYVVMLLERVGPLTADEAAAKLRLQIWSVRPRFSELYAKGLIEPTELTRPNASGKEARVWRRVQHE